MKTKRQIFIILWHGCHPPCKGCILYKVQLLIQFILLKLNQNIQNLKNLNQRPYSLSLTGDDAGYGGPVQPYAIAGFTPQSGTKNTATGLL
jgi:hypothetical protein